MKTRKYCLRQTIKTQERHIKTLEEHIEILECNLNVEQEVRKFYQKRCDG